MRPIATSSRRASTPSRPISQIWNLSRPMSEDAPGQRPRGHRDKKLPRRSSITNCECAFQAANDYSLSIAACVLFPSLSFNSRNLFPQVLPQFVSSFRAISHQTSHRNNLPSLLNISCVSTRKCANECVVIRCICRVAPAHHCILGVVLLLVSCSNLLRVF